MKSSHEIRERETVHFAGLHDANPEAMPDGFVDAKGIDPDSVFSLFDLINSRKIPNAEAADPYVDNPKAGDSDDNLDQLNDWKVIIDPRRAKQAAEGKDVKYAWHVPTSSYSIVTPIEAYTPLLMAIKNYDLDKEVFGTAHLKDYGGELILRVYFGENKMELPDEDEDPIYFGLQTGYDYKGRQSVYARIVGLDGHSWGTIRNLSRKRSRRHVGDPTDDEYERDEDRVPISEWWEEWLANLETVSSNLYEQVVEANETTIKFAASNDSITVPDPGVGALETAKPYTLETFFQLHEMGGYLAELAAPDAYKHSSANPPEVDCWALFRALTEAMEKQDECDEGDTLSGYADVALDLLWNPRTPVEVADEEWNLRLDEDETGRDQNQDVLIPQNVGSLLNTGEGSNSEQETPDAMIQRTAEAREKQERLRSFIGAGG